MTTYKIHLLGLVSLALAWMLTTGHLNAKEIPCGGEGQWCAQNGKAVHKTTYGKETHFAMYTQNVNPLKCSHLTFGGDPEYGKHKTCAWSEVNTLTKYKWKKCANEGQGKRCIVDVKEGEIKMVRFGTPKGNRWLYSYVAESFDCRVKGLGYDVDVAPNVLKQCEVANNPEPYTGKWETCASGEGMDCNFADDGPRLVRYGDAASERFWYKTVLGKNIKCGVGTFRWDPAPNVHKACEYFIVPFEQRIVKVQGKWEKVLSCKGCSSTSFEFTTGVTTGKETVKSSEWGSSLTASLESTVGVLGAEVTAGFTSTVSNSFAKSVGSSFTKEQSSTKNISCARGAIYQFVTSVDEICAAGVCTTTANSNKFICQYPTEAPPS